MWYSQALLAEPSGSFPALSP